MPASTETPKIPPDNAPHNHNANDDLPRAVTAQAAHRIIATAVGDSATVGNTVTSGRSTPLT
jgi:hypothetical protein